MTKSQFTGLYLIALGLVFWMENPEINYIGVGIAFVGYLIGNHGRD